MATIYRMIQRIMVLDISKLVVRDIGQQLDVASEHPDAVFRFLSFEEILEGAKDSDLDLQPEMAHRLNAGLDKCAGAIVDGQLIGYLWIAFEGIEAEHNSGKHANSGIAVSFKADSAFLYKGYAKRAYRKKGFSCLLNWTAIQLAEQHQIRQLISTTEWLNVPAYRALTYGGFKLIGHTWRIILFGIAMDWSPRTASDYGILLGKDAVVPERNWAEQEVLGASNANLESLASEEQEPISV